MHGHNAAVESVLQKRHIEVDQKSEGKTGGLHVTHQLPQMNVVDLVNGLEFHDNQIRDDEVEHLIAEFDVFVPQGDQTLTVKRYSTPTKLVRHRLFVQTLKQPRPENGMNLDRRTDDGFGHTVPLGRNVRCSNGMSHFSHNCSESSSDACSVFLRSLRVSAIVFTPSPAPSASTPGSASPARHHRPDRPRPRSSGSAGAAAP